MNRIDGVPTEFEWTIFPGITTLGFLDEIQSPMRDLLQRQDHLHVMLNDIEWGAKGNAERCEHNLQTVSNCARKFPLGGLSWSLDQKRNGADGSLSKQDNTFALFIQKKDHRCKIFCPEYIMPRYERKTRAWILKNTRIGPVLNMKVCCHDDGYSIEILVESLFEDQTATAGLTDFGQTDFGQFFDRLSVANRGLDRLSPNRLWPILVFLCFGHIFSTQKKAETPKTQRPTF